MRKAASLLLCAALGLRVLPGAAPAAPVRFSGRLYVPLGQWAGAHDYAIHWLTREKVLELTHRKTTLMFTVNSCQASVDGVQLWLSFPLAYQNGRAYISQLDVADTLTPVLFPPRDPRGANGKIICLDPGHGGRDPGNIAGWRKEKTYTLLLAEELRRQLQRAGFTPVLTRARDVYVDLAARPAFAQRRGASLFISLHFNSSDVDRNHVRGVETYCLTPPGAPSTNARGKGDMRWLPANRNDARSMFLAYEVQKTLTRELRCEDRGVRRARFEVLRDATMPAILVEGGFLSNPQEARQIGSPAYRRRMARAILDAVLAYRRTLSE